MKGTTGYSPRRWWHRLGFGRRINSWELAEISNTAKHAIAKSDRGIGLQLVTYVQSEKELRGVTVYLEPHEALTIASKLTRLAKGAA